MTDPLFETVSRELSGSYAVERELGGGGMSRVILATESALGRKVVVKVLSPELAAEVNAERFRREIQVIAQMQHSCIVPVLTSGTVGGLPYYTMPFVEGESLRQRLVRDGELPITEVVRLLRDVLEALSYAHERGVVHRDIKPENVMLTRHHALLTDFGVAKAVSESTNPGAQRLTSVGVALGTPAYMAPEQAAGDPNTDHRADLYAVGALAYEMLTGRPVFSSRSPQAMLAAHAIETPEPLERRRPNTPPALTALVMRTLEKHPADRPQSADEMLRALEAAATPGTGTTTTALPAPERVRPRASGRRYLLPALSAVLVVGLLASYLVWGRDTVEAGDTTGIPSVAVLPFANTSGSRDDEYLSDGISEELIAALSKLPGLQVAARTSSFAFKGRNEDARAIGQRLGVGHILGGSVRRAGNRLRVSAQLTNVSTGYNLWSDTYDREMTDVFGLQEDISRAIVDALELRLASASSRTPIVKRSTADPQAYELYLRGRYLLTQRGASLVPARAHFERAIARDSTFAAAYAGLAETMFVSSSWGYIPSLEAMDQAESNARRALALDPALTDAYMVLGSVRCDRGEFEEAEALFRRAISLEPRSGRVHYFHALCLQRQGRPRMALEEGRLATELEPLNPQLFFALIRAYTMGGRPREALEARRPALELAPNLISLYTSALPAYTLLRDAEAIEAIAERQRVGGSPDSEAQAAITLAIAAAVRGDTARARALIRPYVRDPRPGREMPLTTVVSLLRDEDETLRLIELAYSRLADQVAVVNFPDFDWLRSRPRFQALARKYNIPLRIERLSDRD